jgi:hypothetical protein
MSPASQYLERVLPHKGPGTCCSDRVGDRRMSPARRSACPDISAVILRTHFVRRICAAHPIGIDQNDQVTCPQYATRPTLGMPRLSRHSRGAWTNPV